MRTSLYIHQNTMDMLLDFKEQYKKPVNQIIKRLLRLYICGHTSNHRTYTTIAYQSSDSAENWITHGIDFAEVEHEHFYGSRYFLKFSVSFLLALAVEHYKYIDIYEESNIGCGIFPSYYINTIVMSLSTSKQGLFWKIYWEKT